MPSHSVTPDAVREHLIGEHFAPAQKLPIQVYDATEPSDGDLLADWEVQGVFYNDEQYRGPLSGLGIRLEPYPVAGLVELKALAGYKPLMPEAYIALQTMKASKEQAFQPWTRLIGFALEGDASTSLQEADDAWLDRTFDGYHCCYVRTTVAPCLVKATN